MSTDKPRFREIYKLGLTNPNTNVLGPDPGTVWKVIATFVFLTQDNTTTGSRNIVVKVQSGNFGNFLTTILAQVGNSLSTAGTGTSTFGAWGGYVGIDWFGNTPEPNIMAIQGNLSYLASYHNPIIVVPGFVIGLQGGLQGSDKFDLLVVYEEWPEDLYFKR